MKVATIKRLHMFMALTCITAHYMHAAESDKVHELVSTTVQAAQKITAALQNDIMLYQILSGQIQMLAEVIDDRHQHHRTVLELLGHRYDALNTSITENAVALGAQAAQFAKQKKSLIDDIRALNQAIVADIQYLQGLRDDLESKQKELLATYEQSSDETRADAVRLESSFGQLLNGYDDLLSARSTFIESLKTLQTHLYSFATEETLIAKAVEDACTASSDDVTISSDQISSSNFEPGQ